jgi:hypothetical protein|tara:strand:+ start:51 stop:863 length:813 start_codon:yes stop_codon:yes gene_type:complete
MLKYFITNKIFSSSLDKMVPGYFRKKFLKIPNICFVPTNFNKLPLNNHPIFSSITHHKNIISIFNNTQKEVTFKSYDNLINLLNKKYKHNEEFNFLDFGGDQIDQYLILKKNFPNINYFITNQNEINNHFKEIKKTYNFKNLFILSNLDELLINTYDFANFGSVLQYIDGYDELLNKILTKVNGYVLITAVHLYQQGARAKHVVKQVNLLPNKLYLYFFDFIQFIKIFKDCNFNVVFSEKNKTMDINYKNFNIKEMSDLKYTDILFKKNY